MPDNRLPLWTLYAYPTDFPDEWVVRRHLVDGAGVAHDAELTARGPTREACLAALRLAVPHVDQLAWLPREAGDVGCLVGSWV